MKKELTKEMQKQVKFISRVVSELDSTDGFIGMTKQEMLEHKVIEALQAVAKEAKLELIAVVKEIVWHDRKKALDLLTTLEETLNQE